MGPDGVWPTATIPGFCAAPHRLRSIIGVAPAVIGGKSIQSFNQNLLTSLTRRKEIEEKEKGESKN
jgi:hypothetical protein